MKPRLLSLLFAALLAGCGPAVAPRLPGYAEGDYVRVAAPLAGRLVSLSVQEGDPVGANQPLFRLEQQRETAAVAEARAWLELSQAQLADLQKGKRPAELAVLTAELAASRSAQALADRDFQRQQTLARAGHASQASLDAASERAQSAAAQVRASQASLEVARLAARQDAVLAGEAQERASAAALAQLEWQLAQKSVNSETTGRVEEILYRPGEWVPAGAPVLSLLPEGAIKARFYLPEPRRAELQPGQRVWLHCDGCPEPIPARISFIATQAEFTPPVIYSRDNRAHLVYSVEARPEAATSRLTPGQPLDVTLEPAP